MAIYQAIILGAVQGITEFLPISSSGHLALISLLFGLQGDLLFGVILHVATLRPVTFVYRKELASLFSNGKKIIYLVVIMYLLFIYLVMERSFTLMKVVSVKYRQQRMMCYLK